MQVKSLTGKWLYIFYQENNISASFAIWENSNYPPIRFIIEFLYSRGEPVGIKDFFVESKS